MVVKDYDVSEDTLKAKILASEEKRGYFSDRFEKIEKQVKDSLVKQKADDALKDITI
jgi:hypothetical protein